MPDYQSIMNYEDWTYHNKRNKSLEYKFPKQYSKAAVSGGYSGKISPTPNNYVL